MEVNIFFSIRAPSSCSVGQAIVVNCYALKNSQPASNTYIILNSYVPHYTFSEDVDDTHRPKASLTIFN